jgi:hypothetical protein
MNISFDLITYHVYNFFIMNKVQKSLYFFLSGRKSTFQIPEDGDTQNMSAPPLTVKTQHIFLISVSLTTSEAGYRHRR